MDVEAIGPEAPWSAGQWDGTVHSIEGATTDLPAKADVAEVLYHGEDPDDFDGVCAAVVLLHDGRVVGWESAFGPTGSGFHEDAYGGDAEVWFAPRSELARLVELALTDHGRELCGIPRAGLTP